MDFLLELIVMVISIPMDATAGTVFLKWFMEFPDTGMASLCSCKKLEISICISQWYWCFWKYNVSSNYTHQGAKQLVIFNAFAEINTRYKGFHFKLSV